MNLEPNAGPLTPTCTMTAAPQGAIEDSLTADNALNPNVASITATVGRVMTTTSVTVDAAATVGQARALITDRGLRTVPDRPPRPARQVRPIPSIRGLPVPNRTATRLRTRWSSTAARSIRPSVPRWRGFWCDLLRIHVALRVCRWSGWRLTTSMGCEEATSAYSAASPSSNLKARPKLAVGTSS
jgi:hypothetical protein